MKQTLILLLYLVLTGCILLHSKLSIFYAFTGISLWYEKMLPSLVPFMILSGIMIRMHLTEKFTVFIYPIVKFFFRVSRTGCYAMTIGFLCGFPMGAKTIADLLAEKDLSDAEGTYLLAFCNNIGPVYFCSVVLPLLHRKAVIPYLFGMYGIPLLYGILLRHTRYRFHFEKTETNTEIPLHNKQNGLPFLNALDASISSSMQSVLNLCGYMILFNLCNLIPHLMLGNVPDRLAPLFEITSGLYLVGEKHPLYILLILPFGGFSCIAQTYHCICKTTLSIASYTLHKIILTLCTVGYYFLWYLAAPTSFLR